MFQHLHQAPPCLPAFLLPQVLASISTHLHISKEAATGQVLPSNHSNPFYCPSSTPRPP